MPRVFLQFLALTSLVSAKITTQEQRDAYNRDGYVILSGLLSESELDGLVRGGDIIMKANEDKIKTNPFFSAFDKGIIVSGPSVEMSPEESSFVLNSFRNVALRSKIPRAAAELMGLDNDDNDSDDGKEETVRLLRDVFLGKGLDDPKTCQWHVDDPSFWPESFQSTGGYGVNAWVAMTDMPHGGSLGLAPGSHKAEWRERGYEALGQDHNKTGTSKDELLAIFKKGSAASTCALDLIDKELYDTIEETAYFPKLMKGDIIFHTRWLFHKTMALTDEDKAAYREQGLSALNRYSLRYVSGKATLPTGFINELSYFSDPTNAGHTLDDITQKDAPWYPKVFPSVEENFSSIMASITDSKVAPAKASALAASAELIRLIQSSTTPEAETKEDKA